MQPVASLRRQISLALKDRAPEADTARCVLTECILCGSDQFSCAYPARIPWLMRCRKCGVGFVNPQPSVGELEEIYGERYYQTFGFHFERDCAFRRMKQATVERLLRRARRLLPSPGCLLDVGSGVGDVLVVGRRLGWATCGAELNPLGVEAAEMVAPGATRVGPFEELTFGEAPFELITCFDVLEHLRRPDSALRKMFQLLTPGGVLLIAVPDVGSLLACVMGTKWPHYHRDHLWYFNRTTLRRLVQKSGFEILQHGQCWKTFNLQYVLGILAEHPHTGLFHSIAGRLKDRLPRWLLGAPWPIIPEGQLLLARKPSSVRTPERPAHPR